MKVTCNGCRVLRKGCSDDCTIRPCLQWIGSPEAQANATLFLAKFYGRAGLVNLLSAGPVHLRPSMFRSLLYEACGRIVHPIYGSVGLLSSRNWLICQAAVNAVLHGKPIGQIASAAAVPARACVNHHVGRSTDAKLHKVPKPRSRFKRSSANTRPKALPSSIVELQQGPPAGTSANGENQKNGSVFYVEKAEGSRGSQTDLKRKTVHGSTAKNVGLDLTLGLRSARTIPFESKVSGPSTISSVDRQFSYNGPPLEEIQDLNDVNPGYR